MTFVDFKKHLLDANLSIPKFANLIKVSEKNIQAYKKKEEVPNSIAVVAVCFAKMNKEGIDYKEIVEQLQLSKKSKSSGFSKKKKAGKS